MGHFSEGIPTSRQEPCISQSLKQQIKQKKQSSENMQFTTNLKGQKGFSTPKFYHFITKAILILCLNCLSFKGQSMQAFTLSCKLTLQHPSRDLGREKKNINKLTSSPLVHALPLLHEHFSKTSVPYTQN